MNEWTNSKKIPSTIHFIDSHTRTEGERELVQIHCSTFKHACSLTGFVRSNGNIASFVSFKLMFSFNIGNEVVDFFPFSIAFSRMSVCARFLFDAFSFASIPPSPPAIAAATAGWQAHKRERKCEAYSVAPIHVPWGIINNMHTHRQNEWAKKRTHKTNTSIQATNIEWNGKKTCSYVCVLMFVEIEVHCARVPTPNACKCLHVCVCVRASVAVRYNRYEFEAAIVVHAHTQHPHESSSFV